MSRASPPKSDPVAESPPGTEVGLLVPTRQRAAIRLRVRGRTVWLRGLRRPPPKVLLWLAILGPGLIAGTAGDDAGGIATYSQVGAKYGYDFLWVMLWITVSLGLVQETSARIGAATGRGLLDLIRERFGIAWALFAVAAIMVTNCSILISEFIGVGSALELFGVTKLVVIPLSAVCIGYLVVAGSYDRAEKVLLVMTLAFLAYPISAVVAHPDWAAVASGLAIPKLRPDPRYLLLLVATIGTTISPYQPLFQQSASVERGTARRHYGSERADSYVGAIISNVISIFIIIAAAATLHAAGKTDLQTAADAAQALKPVAGPQAELLFAIGIVGASLMGAAVLPLVTAYAVTEAFGFPKGVDLDFRRGRVFLGLFCGLIAVAAVIALVAPTSAMIQVLVYIQLLNGILMPIMLSFMMLLANDHRLMGSLKNGRAGNAVGWLTVGLITAAIVVGLGAELLSLVGLGPGGS